MHYDKEYLLNELTNVAKKEIPKSITNWKINFDEKDISYNNNIIKINTEVTKGNTKIGEIEFEIPLKDKNYKFYEKVIKMITPLETGVLMNEKEGEPKIKKITYYKDI